MAHVMAPEFFDYDIHGVDAYASILSGVRIEITQLLPGHLRGHHTRIRIPEGELSWIATSLPLRGRGILPEGRWTLSVVTRTAGRSMMNGLQLRAGTLMIQPPAVSHDGFYGKDFSVVCLGILPDRFEQCFADVLRMRPGGGHAYQASTRGRADLVAQFDAAAHELRYDTRFRRSTTKIKAMLGRLTAAFAQALSGAAPIGDQPVLREGALLVSRAEAALAVDRDHMLRVSELSEVLCVPTRSLNRAFYLVLGIGPATYLRRHRLSEARRMLLGEQEQAVSVTEVATRFGFRHMGRFSAQYRNLFNELPHVTRGTPRLPDRLRPDTRS